MARKYFEGDIVEALRYDDFYGIKPNELFYVTKPPYQFHDDHLFTWIEIGLEQISMPNTSLRLYHRPLKNWIKALLNRIR